MKSDLKPTYRLVVAEDLHAVGWEQLQAAADIEVVLNNLRLVSLVAK